MSYPPQTLRDTGYSVRRCADPCLDSSEPLRQRGDLVLLGLLRHETNPGGIRQHDRSRTFASPLECPIRS